MIDENFDHFTLLEVMIFYIVDDLINTQAKIRIKDDIFNKIFNINGLSIRININSYFF
jgi:hypothetical protein